MKEMYTKENFNKFLDTWLFEQKANFIPAKYEIKFYTALAWDGKDWYKHREEKEAKAKKRKEEREKKKAEEEE